MYVLRLLERCLRSACAPREIQGDPNGGLLSGGLLLQMFVFFLLLQLLPEVPREVPNRGTPPARGSPPPPGRDPLRVYYDEDSMG